LCPRDSGDPFCGHLRTEHRCERVAIIGLGVAGKTQIALELLPLTLQ
jgi:hypothetical protein